MKTHLCPACKAPMILTGTVNKWWLCPVCNVAEKYREKEDKPNA